MITMSSGDNDKLITARWRRRRTGVEGHRKWESERRRATGSAWQRLAFILWHPRIRGSNLRAAAASALRYIASRFNEATLLLHCTPAATDRHSSCERRRRQAIYCFHHPRSHSKLLQLGALPLGLATASSLVHNLRRTSLIASARDGI